MLQWSCDNRMADLANCIIFQIFRGYQKCYRRNSETFLVLPLQVLERNQAYLKNLFFSANKNIPNHAGKKNNKKMQNNLSEERLRKDNGLFVEIA